MKRILALFSFDVYRGNGSCWEPVFRLLKRNHANTAAILFTEFETRARLIVGAVEAQGIILGMVEAGGRKSSEPRR